MLYAIPGLPFEKYIDCITQFELVNRLQTGMCAHDPAIPKRNFNSKFVTIDGELKVLSAVPVVVGSGHCTLG
jgi:hypothetical protein